ncbi:MAG TPA: hypothetical protein VGR85_01215 [Candidatus Limnocylindria bacterium]|jgi:hypothetical protein|nr:hypothetical protein [Candidatus Limnocylindria bacterium]
MAWPRRFVTAIAVLITACGGAPLAVAPASASPSPTGTVAKSAQAALPPPTYLRWAVDRAGGNPTLPYVLEFFHDGYATSFRIFDGSGQLAFRVPIAGSGVFGPESCMVRGRPPGKTENATWIGVDAATLERFMRDAPSYRVEADSVGGPTLTIPLSDSGCRDL